MKIWELLDSEHEGVIVRNADDSIRLLVQKVQLEEGQAEEDEPEFALVNKDGERIALTNKILKMEWDIIPPSKWDRVKEKEKYFYMDDKLDIKPAFDDGSLTDELRFSNLNYFQDKDLAYEVRLNEFFNRIMMKLRDSIEEKPKDENIRYFIKFKNVTLIDKPELTVDELRDMYSVEKVDFSEDLIPYGLVLFPSEELARMAAEQMLREPIGLFGMTDIYLKK